MAHAKEQGAPGKTMATRDVLYMGDGETYQLQSEPVTDEQVMEFSKLTEEEKVKFFEFRNSALEKIATVLHKQSGKVGAVVGTAQRLTLKDGEVGPSNQAAGRAAVQSALSEIDTGLWDTIKMISKPLDQKGMIAAGVINGGIGVGKFGFFRGLHLGLGWGYDRVRNQKYVDVFYITDKFKGAATFLLNAFGGAHVAYRSGPTNDGPNVQKINRSGTGITMPVGLIYLGNETLLLMSGGGIELGFWMGGVKFLQLYTTHWQEKGVRVYFKPKIGGPGDEWAVDSLNSLGCGNAMSLI